MVFITEISKIFLITIKRVWKCKLIVCDDIIISPPPLYSLPIPYSPLPSTHSLFPIPHSPLLTPHSPLPITQAKRKMYLPSSVSCDKNVKIFFFKCIWIVPALWIRIRSIWDLYSVAFWIQIHIHIPDPDPHIYKFKIQRFNWVNISLGDILF